MHGAFQAIRVLAVLALLAGFLWWLRRYDRKAAAPTQRRAGRPVEILGQARLSRQATVAVVRVGARSLTLGVTDHGVNLLAEAEYVEPVVESQDEATVEVADRTSQQVAAAGQALTDYWRRITTRVPASERPSFASALQLATAAAAPTTPKSRARTEGSTRPAAKKATPATGSRRTTAPRARKPEPHTPK